MRAVFDAPTTTWRDRKQLLRAVIAEVVVTVRVTDRQADVRIIWEGGASTEFVLALNKTGGHFRATDEDTVALVRRLAERYDDTTIAMILSQQHRRTGTGLAFTRSRVNSLRHAHGIPVFEPDDCHTRLTMMARRGHHLSSREAARRRQVHHLSVAARRVHHRRAAHPGGALASRITDELRQRIVPDVPDGWLPLDQAARALGVARQTVLHKVQRGELAAVHVNRGKRKGLRIQVEPATPGLFATAE